ncbi:MAG: cysteine desulfurase family protein [Gemmataceae bacterium]
MIYLDHAATTPTRPEAVEAVRALLAGPPGNPASAHAAGRRARQSLEDARERIAAVLHCEPAEVIFTSGATEANNLALFGLAGHPPGRIVASPVEHPCVAEPLRQLAARGFTVEYLPVDRQGIVDLSHLGDIRLVTAMLVNHETGAALTMAARSPWHTDAAQAVGKVAVDFRALGVTALTLSAHKFGGPPGIGVLVLQRGTPLRPLLYGGHQQQGRRPGTEPVALAAGLAVALELAEREREANWLTVATLRERFLTRVASAAPVVVNSPTGGVPHILNVSFPGCEAQNLLIALDLVGVACSTGSACSSGSLLPSPVLRAMGVPDDVLRSAMRFSFAATTAATEVDEAADRIVAAARHLRQA